MIWMTIANVPGRFSDVLAEFMLHDPIADEYWHELFDRFSDYQFALLDTETNRMAAMGNSLPFCWDEGISNTAGRRLGLGICPKPVQDGQEKCNAPQYPVRDSNCDPPGV